MLRPLALVGKRCVDAALDRTRREAAEHGTSLDLSTSWGRPLDSQSSGLLKSPWGVGVVDALYAFSP